MCTVTVRNDGRGLLLTMNRDEAWSRAAERAPCIHGMGESCWAGPLDGAAGGTWLGANAWGVAACLLNAYPAESAPGAADRPSRGTIIPALLGRGPMNEAQLWLEREFDPAPFAPFTLVLAGVGYGVCLNWTGLGRLSRMPLPSPWAMVASSGWRTAEVADLRGKWFEAWLAQGCSFKGLLPSFHLYQPAGCEALSPLMRRRDSHTRSITQIWQAAGGETLEVRYWPEPAGKPVPPAAATHLPMNPKALRMTLA